MSGMEHAIEQAAKVIRDRVMTGTDWAETSGDFIDVQGVVNPLAEALAEAGLLAPAPLREECHFAPYGSYKATCGETVPVPSEWDENVGNYISPRFTVYRDETTCWACRVQFVDRAESDGKAER